MAALLDQLNAEMMPVADEKKDREDRTTVIESIREEDEEMEEEDEEEDDDEGGGPGRHMRFGGENLMQDVGGEAERELADSKHSAPPPPPPLPDALQAFSHFTYRQTHRRKLVCDLQGVLVGGSGGDDAHGAHTHRHARAQVAPQPPRFLLTDPVIHFKKKNLDPTIYGRTNKGQKGMHAFFASHTCNAYCRLLGLTGNLS
jgi:hypothetical protein